MALAPALLGIALRAQVEEPPALLPVVSVQVLRHAAETGAVAGAFEIRRDGEVAAPLEVRYRIRGTAQAGPDYVPLPGRVTIPAGEAAVEIPVVPVDDQVEEPPEALSLELEGRADPFTIAVLPDTQFYTAERFAGRQWMFTAQTRWIVEHQDPWNFAFVLHEGDVTDGNTPLEWQRAKASMSLLDGVVPYAVAVGNHDGLMSRAPSTELFNQCFPVAQFQDRPGFGGVFEPGRMDNGYWFFSAGGIDWMVLSLEFGPRDAVLDWANDIVAQHPDRRVLVVTHAHVYVDNTLHGSSADHLWLPTSYGRPNNGTDVWEKLLRRHPNVAFVFNGHVLKNGTGRVVGTGDAGNRVYQMLADYQTQPAGGSGFLRLVQFIPAEDRMVVRTFSPVLDQWLDDPENQFEYTHLGMFTNAAPAYRVDPARPDARLLLSNNDLDPTPPRLVRVTYAGVPPEFRLTFDRSLDAASAGDPTHYSFHGEGGVRSAELLPDQCTVQLCAEADLPTTTVTLRVAGLKSALAASELAAPIEYPFTYQPTLLATDFATDTLDGWTAVDQGTFGRPSLWAVQDGRLVQLASVYGPTANASDHRQGTLLVSTNAGPSGWTNFSFDVSFRTLDAGSVGVVFRYQNPSNYYKLDCDGQHRTRKLFRLIDGVETTLASEGTGYQPPQDYVLRGELAGDEITLLLNERVLFGRSLHDDGLQCGTVGLYTWGSVAAAFDRVAVTPLAQSPRVELENPSADAALSPLDPIRVAVHAMDPDDPVVQVELSLDKVPLQTLTAAPFEFAWTNATPGSHTLQARAVDLSGRATLSLPLRVWVEPLPPPPSFLDQPRSQDVMEGDGAKWLPEIVGGLRLSYQWTFNGADLPDATNAFLLFNHVEPGNAGLYRLRVSSPLGDCLSDSAELIVRPKSPPDPGDPPPPEAVIRSITRSRSGQFLVSVQAAPNTLVELQSSPDLRTWTTTSSLTNLARNCYFAPRPEPPERQRFYRITTRPQEGP